MDALTRTIDAAVAASDYAALATVFSSSRGGGPSSSSSSSPLSWQDVGQGEQRSLASHLIRAVIASPTFLSGGRALSSPPMMDVFLEALAHLPSTVEGGADNKLRQLIFDHKVNEDGDYAAAARVLSGTRMDDDPNSVYHMTPAEKCEGE
jgi:hypothetical protein